MTDYWEECIRIALGEADITASDEQVGILVSAVEGGYENYGMAHGYDCIPNPVEYQAQRELRELKQRIKKKEDWIASTDPCRKCTTTGTVRDCWGRPTDCPDCNGEGRTKRFSWR